MELFYRLFYLPAKEFMIVWRVMFVLCFTSVNSSLVSAINIYQDQLAAKKRRGCCIYSRLELAIAAAISIVKYYTYARHATSFNCILQINCWPIYISHSRSVTYSCNQYPVLTKSLAMEVKGPGLCWCINFHCRNSTSPTVKAEWSALISYFRGPVFALWLECRQSWDLTLLSSAPNGKLRNYVFYVSPKPMFPKQYSSKSHDSTQHRQGFREKWWNKYIAILKYRKQS